jgi:hypothetical protein
VVCLCHTAVKSIPLLFFTLEAISRLAGIPASSKASVSLHLGPCTHRRNAFTRRRLVLDFYQGLDVGNHPAGAAQKASGLPPSSGHTMQCIPCMW